MNGKWAVSCQTIGEVLTTDIQGDGLRILVFSTRIELDPLELESRVTRLAATALDAAGRESRPRPVPRLLHYTMGEVLGLLNELERASGHPASAVAFYGNELEVSFAYSGGQDPALEGLASGTDAPWIRMTYGEVPGDPASAAAAREVRGFSLFARANLDIRLRWVCAFGVAENQGVEVVARWRGSSDVTITMRNMRVEPARMPPADPSAPKGESFFAGWFDDLEAEFRADAAKVSRARAAAGGATPHPAPAPRAADAPAPTPAARAADVPVPPPPAPRAADVRVTPPPAARAADVPPGGPAVPVRTWAWPPQFDSAPAAPVDDDAEFPEEFAEEAIAHEDAPALAAGSDAETAAYEEAIAYEEPSAYEETPALDEAPSADSDEDEAYEDAAAFAAGADEEGVAYEDAAAAGLDEEVVEYEEEVVAYDDEAATDTDAGIESIADAEFRQPRVSQRPVEEAIPVRKFLEDSVPYEAPEMVAPSPVGDFVMPSSIPVEVPRPRPWRDPMSGEPVPEAEEVPWVEAAAAPSGEGSAARPRRMATGEGASPWDLGHGFNWRRAAPWIAFAAALFALGAWLGIRGSTTRQVYGSGGARTASPLGFGGPRFTVHVTSDPDGAGIWVDDQPTTLRTPADVDLKPGPHRVSVGDAESGLISYDVQGDRGRVTLHAELEGSLQVDGPMADSVLVYVDGELRGRAPLRLAGLAPGLHEVEFAVRGQPPRLQTVRVPTRGTARLEVKPLELPPTGMLEVRAAVADGDGTTDVRGAVVYIDGERRGGTPLSLELPRGPHSVRVVNGSEDSGVQMIDLPGGNIRYANFTLGGGLDAVSVELRNAGGNTPANIVAAVPELSRRDVREMWLHVRSPQGVWQRNPMTIRVGSRGPEGAAPFPYPGRAVPWYVSVLGSTGEEYFTEIQEGRPAPKPAPAVKRVIPQAVIKPHTSLPAVTETPTP